MEIKFKKSTEEVCCKYSIAERKYGNVTASRLHAIVQYIRSAATFIDILMYKPFQCCHIGKNNIYSLSLDATHNLELLIMPLDSKGKELDNRNVDYICENSEIVFFLEVKCTDE